MSSRDNIELNNVRNGMKDKHDNILVEESEQISSLDVKMLQNIRTTYYQTFDRYDEFEKVKRNFKTTAPIFPKTNSQTSEMIEKLALQLGKPTNKRWFGVRHIQVFLAFYLMFIAYGLRVNLSVGIVAMTDPKASPNPEIPTFPEWKDTSVILSSFFWGYLPPQAFAGQLAKRYGPKWFLVSAMLICCLFTYLLPVLATKYGSAGVMFCRIMQGVGQGFVYPMIHDLLSKWVPPSERSRMGTYVYAGGSLGTVVSMLLTGILSGSWWGWPSVFYTYGTITLIWILLMAYLGSNDPSEHKFIKEEEKLYIEKGSARTIGEKCPTPWKDIFTSWPVWSLIVVHCGQNWGFWTLMTEIPSYISGVMEYEIESNSYLSGLPYFTLWVLSFIFSAIADFLINRKITSIGATRKILNSIGLFVPAVSLIALGFMTKERKEAAIALLTIGVGTNAAIYSGFNINHIDIAPNHSGILMAISNGASNVCALIAPLFVQVVVTDQKDATQWRIVFMFTASLYVVTNCVFLIFGTGELQDWNEPKHKRKANDIFRTAQISVPPQPTIKTC